MHAKFLRILVAFGLTFGSMESHGSGQRCFKNMAQYMAADFGDRYKSDDSIVVEQQRYGSQIFTQVMDTAGGTNITFSLLRRDPARGLCEVLRTFPVVDLKVTRFDRARRPLEFLVRDQAPGDQPSNEVTYALNATNMFVPARCRKIWHNDDNKAVTLAIPCAPLMKELGANPTD